MKTHSLILFLAISAALFILPGCYTQLSYRDRDYRWHGYDRDYDDQRDQAAVADTTNTVDSTYADNDEVADNYYYEGFASPSWHFRYYHPSLGFNLAYGDCYDPFWGDPWWGCTPWYTPFAFYSPWWGYGGWWGWNHYDGYWGGHHGLWAYERPGYRGLDRNERGFGRSLSGRDLVRMNTAERSRQVMPGLSRRSVAGDANLGRSRNVSAFTRVRTNADVSNRSISAARSRITSAGSANQAMSQNPRSASVNQSRQGVARDNRASIQRRNSTGRAQASASRARVSSPRTGSRPSSAPRMSAPRSGGSQSHSAPSRGSSSSSGGRGGHESGRR